MTRAHPDEAGLIERFLKAEALRQFREKARHARFVAAGQAARRRLLRALGVGLPDGAADREHKP